MLQYLVGRVLWAVVLFLASTVVVYVLFFLLPANPVQLGRGQFAEGTDIADAFELDGPVYEEWAQFVWGIVHEGSLGESVANRRPVSETIMTAVPVTLSLVLGGAVVWLLIAVPLGVLSGLRPRSLLDRTGMVFVLIGISAHPVWIGLILRYFFSVKLGVTPVTGYCELVSPSRDCGGPTQWAWHMLLPWITFALLFSALYVRMIRASVMETINEDFVRTAHAKGAPRWLVLRSHVLRNALLPVVTMLGLDMGVALGGSIFIERVFGLPGIGSLALEALTRRDLPVILGVTVFGMIGILLFNLVVDLVYAVIDPRVRVRGRGFDVEDRRLGRGVPEPVPAPKGV